ncbi:MAG: RlmE family RNA methyltransferase [Deltaproteobacteria bacterium]|nr:RlmE family RNA methyltransferase [Deltaproteobacteria bacterium]
MSPVYERKDRYYKKAKEAGHASRAIFKLDEIDQRFHLIQAQDRILELGCAPGGWLQYLAKKIKPNGRVVGVDLLDVKITLPSFIQVKKGDATQPEVQQACIDALEGKANLILSDMSPNLSGIRFKDCYASYQLALVVLDVSKKILKEGGHLLLKIFPGDEYKDFEKKVKQQFKEMKTFIPDATRKGSSEIYIIAKGFRSE